jgi:hypothetical protein
MKCGQEGEKPVSVLDYNENIGGVDLKTSYFNPVFWKERK